MVPDHYFSADPKSESTPREIGFDFLGERLSAAVDAGVFSATRLDAGTRVLLNYLESHSQADDKDVARVIDIGCGWGPISIALGKKYPEAEVIGVDVNRRALENTTRNLAMNRVSRARAMHPELVPEGYEFDEIWSNPPIRIGKVALHELLMEWLPRLGESGTATIVVAKQLGAPSLQQWLNSQPNFRCTKLLQEKGYWLLRVTRER